MMARALRGLAIAIAVAGVVDPTLTRETLVRQPLAIVVADESGMSSGQRLRELLETDYDVAAYTPVEWSKAAACPAQGGCVLVADGRMPERVTAGAKVIGAVRPSVPDATVITAVAVPGPVHVRASALLSVRVTGAASRLEVFDDGILVGASDIGGAGTLHDVTVEWVPIAAGVRRLTVRAGHAEAQVGVVVADAAVPVLYHEPEATWLGTFVRRALEDDARFAVEGRTRLAPPVAVTRGSLGRAVGSMTRESLSEAGTVVVTAPDALSAAEVDLLERFVRIRGGSLILLPDRRITGAVTRLVPRIIGERRENAPVAVGPLRATEILSFDGRTTGVTVLESAGERAVVVSRALGRGRVIASGALDAWRNRDGGGAFKGFWTSLVADAGAAAGATLNVTVDPPLLAHGEEAVVVAEWRTLADLPAKMTAEASLRCGGARSSVRLWPGARPGTFTGTVRAEAMGECDLAVKLSEQSLGTTDAAGEREVKSSVHISAGHRTQKNKLAPPPVLTAAMAAHGGVVVTTGDESGLAARVREQMPARREPRESRPVRSPWWIVPFAACLGGEWWLRRRAGLR